MYDHEITRYTLKRLADFVPVKVETGEGAEYTFLRLEGEKGILQCVSTGEILEVSSTEARYSRS